MLVAFGLNSGQQVEQHVYAPNKLPYSYLSHKGQPKPKLPSAQNGYRYILWTLQQPLWSP